MTFLPRLHAAIAEATPGPWQSQHGWDRAGVAQIIGNIDGPDDDRFHYTRVCEISDELSADECFADARLIVLLVNAAPQIAAALEAAKEIAEAEFAAIDEWHASGGPPWNLEHPAYRRAVALRAALAALDEEK